MHSLTADPVLGVGVPRSRRSGGRIPRTWRTSMLQLQDLVEETVLEDEREALEALCFLSAGSCDAPDPCLGTKFLPVPAKQQHSKGSSLTAEAIDAPDSKAVAVTSRRHSGRLPSPGSDVSSGGSQGAMLHSQQQLQLPEALPVPLDEIHPGAHPVDIEQLVPPSTQCKQQRQQPRQQPYATAGKKRKQHTQYQQSAPQATQLLLHPQQAEHMPECGRLAAPAVPLDSNPAAAHLGGSDAVQSSMPQSSMLKVHGVLSQAAVESSQMAAAPGQAAAGQNAAMGFHQVLPPQVGHLLQPGSQQLAAAAAAGLNPAQLAALVAAAAVGPASLTNLMHQQCPQQQPNGLSQLFAQLLVSPGWPAAGAPLQPAPQTMLSPCRQLAVKRPPVDTCYWHVYIAKMIADGRRKEHQQRSGDAPAAGAQGCPSKRQKIQQAAPRQQPAVQQSSLPTLPNLASMLGGTAALAPGLAQTLMAAVAAGQCSAPPVPPAVAQPHHLASLLAPGVLPAASSSLPPDVLWQLLGLQHTQHAPGTAQLGFPTGMAAAGTPAVAGVHGFAPGPPASMPGAALQQLQTLHTAPLPGMGLVAQ